MNDGCKIGSSNTERREEMTYKEFSTLIKLAGIPLEGHEIFQHFLYYCVGLQLKKENMEND